MNPHVIHISPFFKVAIKIIDVKNAARDFIEIYIPREIQIHQELPAHDHVVSL
jgi:hypothetical protein